ncbi:outer membrane protein [Aquibium sp. ELW1220]|uniref:outer membrane protein n=1 Tax=Aquibium sp. ELW1220 TaxID=2976766 RepID=UPI0025AF34A1|nr:outer membrane protein [Aquibium sp. ELW1220]MDN2583094.1 porin family protein [Aquibium sp. ELW1220]
MSIRSNIGRSAAAAFGVAALLSTTSVFAADVIGNEPPAPQPIEYEQVPVASWAGAYAGIQGGYSFGESDINSTVTNSIDTDGFNGSLFGGWNGQSGMFVYGIEGDVGYDWADGTNAGASTERGFNGSLRARMGVAATDNILVYATGGGAVAEIEANDGLGFSDSNTMYGWTAGVGADVKLTEKVFARGEYRYTDYGSDDFALSGGATEVDATSNNFLLGIGMKF